MYLCMSGSGVPVNLQVWYNTGPGGRGVELLNMYISYKIENHDLNTIK